MGLRFRSDPGFVDFAFFVRLRADLLRATFTVPSSYMLFYLEDLLISNKI